MKSTFAPPPCPTQQQPGGAVVPPPQLRRPGREMWIHKRCLHARSFIMRYFIMRSQRISCDGIVDHHKINKSRDSCPHRCDNCRRVISAARVVVTELRESCRRNLEITCHAHHFSRSFYSGRGNQIVVQLNSEGEILATVVKRTWKESLKDAVAKGCNKFTGFVFSVVETIAGALGMGSPFLALTGNSFKIPVSQLSNFDVMTGKLFKITY